MMVSLKEIKSFIEGNYKFYKDKFGRTEPFIKEQVQYRLYLCKNDCLIKNKCVYCNCPPRKKSFVRESCNKGERFPDLMGKKEWEEFKRKNEINYEE